MRKLYNRAFKTGFIATLAVFGVANVVSYVLAAREYEELSNRPIAIAPGPSLPPWGFPFNWDGYNLSYSKSNAFGELFALADGLVLNFLAVCACGFLIGLLVRSLTSK